MDQEELGKAAEETGQETEARTLLGELFEIYYDNRSTQSNPIFDNIWQYVTIFDNIWQYVTICNNIWKYLTIFDKQGPATVTRPARCHDWPCSAPQVSSRFLLQHLEVLLRTGWCPCFFLQHIELVRTGWCPCSTKTSRTSASQLSTASNVSRISSMVRFLTISFWIERQLRLIPGEGDMTMMFSESSLVRNIFSKMSEISVIYTVQILPRTDKVCITM